jgi:hypothetical protein
MTAEERTAVGKIAGAASWRRRTPEQREDWQRKIRAGRQQAVAARGGEFYVSDETRWEHMVKMEELGLIGGEATLERHGREHFVRIAALAGDALTTGCEVTCVFCCDAARPLWQTPTQRARGWGCYHRGCYEAFRRTLPQREKSRAPGTVGWIRSRIRASGDAGLIARLERQIDAQIAHLVDPRREGRPPTLLTDKDLALTAAELHDRGGLTAREIGDLLGAVPADHRNKDRYGNLDAPRRVKELIRLGRALHSSDQRLDR